MVLVTIISVVSITRAGTSQVYAAAPATLNFQARLLSSTGSLVPDGTYNIEFKLYNASSSSGSSQGSCVGDANCLWTETRTGGNKVEVKNGYLSAYLGDVSALPSNIWNQQLWLTMNIGGTGAASWDGEMTPRIRLTSVPYAFRATVANSAETLSKNTGSFTGTVDFSTMTADRTFLFPDTSLATTGSPGTICVFNGAASNCPAASGSAYYIQNDTTVQTQTNFNIQARDSATNGTIGAVVRGAAAGQTVDLMQFQATAGTVLAAVTAAGNLQVASSLDVRSAGTLNIGTTTATALTIGKTAITTTIAGALTVNEATIFNDDVTLAAGQYLRITGDNTAGRPASPTEGMLFYDTTTKQLLIYANGKWQADRSAATKIVAPSNASQAVKDAADYVTDGTADEVEINAALTAASGGKVYLTEGTFVAAATILIPNNTTLVGAGRGTVIEMADTDATDNLVENSDTSTGTGITIQNLRLDGRKDLNTTGSQYGIYLNGMGSGSGSSARQGAVITDVWINNFNARGISLLSSSNNVVADNTIQANTGYGITLSTSSDRNKVTGNIVQGNSSYGMNISGSLYNVISSNNVAGNASGGVLLQSSANNNTLTANNFNDNGGSGANDSINLTASDSNSITDNRITDTAGSGHAINISDSTSDTNYLADNYYSGTGATTLNNVGTGTIFAGQLDSSNNFVIDPSGTVELQSNTNVTGTLAATVGLTAPLLDTGSAVALNIGTTNANAVSISRTSVTTTVNGALVVSEGTTLNGGLTVSSGGNVAFQRNTTDITTTGTLTDLAIGTGALFRFNGASAQTLSSIASPADGRVVTIVNAAATALTIQNDTGGTAGNRIVTGTGADLSVPTGAAVMLTYDSSASRWRVVGSSAASGGGANQQLSNLSGTVAINASLTTGVDNTLDLGSSSFSWRSLYADTSVLTPSVDVASAGALSIGNSTATSVSICNSAACDAITLGTNADADTITVGDATDTIGINGTLTVIGNTSIATTAGNTLSLGNSTGALTVTGDSSSNFVLNGITVGSAEFTLLDGRDTALVDTTDAVATAITGTGALNAGSITSGFGAIDTGADNITTTGTLQATTSVLTQALDRTSAGALTIGATTATSIVLGQNTSLSGASTFTSGTGTVLLQGNTDIAATVSLATKAGTTYTTAGSANDVAISTASLYRLDTSGAAQTITGIVAGRDGQILTLVSADASLAVTLSNNSGSSSVGNKIITGTGGDLSLPAGSSVTLIYDSTDTVWRVVGSSATSGGGANQQLSNLSGTVAVNASLTTGADNTLDLGSSAFSWRTLYADTSVLSPSLDTATAGTLSVGTVTANAIAVGRSGITTTITGGLTQLTGAISLSGNAASSVTTSSGALTLTSAAAAVWSTTAGNLTIQAGGGTVTLGTSTALTATAALGITSGGANALSLDAGGAAALNLGTTNATSVSVSRTGVTTTINGALTATQATTLNGGLTLSNGGNLAVQRNTSDITTTGTLTDLAIGTGSLFRFSGASAQTLSSIASPADGRIVTIINDAATALTIQNDTGGTAANRIITGTGTDLSVPAGATVTLIYDSSDSRWRVVGSSATAGGSANQQLSNLSGTVAVNASLTTGADNTLDLGSSAFSWRTLYADTSVLTPSVDVASAGTLSIGNATATAVSVCNSANCDTIQIGTNADADAIQIGDATDTLTFTGTLAVVGAATINDNANFATNINTGTNNTLVTIGGGSGTFSLQTTNIDISNTGVVSGVTGITYGSGAYNFDQSSSTGTFATGTGAVSLNSNTTVTGNITLAQGANRTVSVGANASNAAGYNLTVAAGAAGAGASPFAGGTLTLQGGAAGGTGNANGGSVAISGGAATGTGTQGLVNLSTTAFTSATVQTFGSSASITAGNIDLYSTLPVTASTTSVVVTVPDPAQAVIGRIVYISARSGSNDFTLRLNSARTPIDIAMKANSTATLIWNGTDWTAAGASSSTDLQSAYNNTLTSAGGAELVLNASGGAADGLTIRNNATTPISGGLLEIQTSIGTNLFSVNNNISELAANGGSENSSTFSTNWTSYGTSTVTRNTTSGQYATGTAGAQFASTTAASGLRNNLATNPATSTNYMVSFTAKLETGSPAFTDMLVEYSANGGTTRVTCLSGQTVSSATWTRFTCEVNTGVTAVSNADIIISQVADPGAPTRTVYIDNLSMTLADDAGGIPNNVQIGGGIYGGAPTLFTLDRSSAPPVANGNTTYYGSMYYDTTTGRIQCYESDGWGACGSAPDNIITLTPEYSGAVLNGSGVGTMTADFCANQATILVVGTLCASGEARNFYRWTSPQATLQSYSIYVTYKLPGTFKEFLDNNTMKLTAYRDDSDDTDALVTMATYRKSSSGGITQCGTTTDITNSLNSWEQNSVGGSENSCSFVGGDYIVFQITASARSNKNVYIENLDFTYLNQ